MKIKFNGMFCCTLLMAIAMAITLCGCETTSEFMQVFFGKDGKPHTPLTDGINETAKWINMVSSFIPGYGVVGKGISGSLMGISYGILTYLTRKRGKRATTMEGVTNAVISGVNESSENLKKLKQGVLSIEATPEIKDKLRNIFLLFEHESTPKKTIKKVAKSMNNEFEVMKEVRRVENS